MRRRLALALPIALVALLVLAPMALGLDRIDGGEGTYGETDDKVITNAGFILIGFFPLFIFFVSLLQWRLEKRKYARQAAAKRAAEEDAKPDDEGEDEDEKKPAPKKRARRSGGRTRRRDDATGSFEGTFDHGEEGYGLWLDPAVEDNPTYAEHWAGHRPVEVTIEEDQIVIRRASGGDNDD